jgi:hypothetical protein
MPPPWTVLPVRRTIKMSRSMLGEATGDKESFVLAGVQTGV